MLKKFLGTIIALSLVAFIFISSAQATLTIGPTSIASDGSFILQGSTVTLTGNLDIPRTTSSAGIIYIAGDRFIHTFGPNSTSTPFYLDNLFIGRNSGNFTTTGNTNLAVGTQNLSLNTDGSYNTAVGVVALTANTSGSGNTAIGAGALGTTTSGSNNSGVGLNAMMQNTTGGTNVGLGQNALLSNQTGSSNTALGYDAGFGLSGTGLSNMIGNTLVGFWAGAALQTGGNYNILIGYQAGDAVTTGSKNIIIGYNIDAPSATGTQQLSIGNLIYGTGLDGTGSTPSTGNIGIGTASPATKLDVNGAITIRGAVNTTNCTSSVGTCTSAPSGAVTIAAAATTVTVSTTAVTANSNIIISEDSSMGTRLGVTCNTTTGRDYTVTARTAATSFVITSSAAPSTNPACLSYWIVN